ncbi:NigD-like protein [Proteiniphilum saccharofermentans]|uniref:NigD-like protein n=1 Tax=Proteiniphilum saccharofermentans TaxID=1642647 RepID=A0A1R3T558_9BACT|nr:NigD-like C-terminal domain-containing protein [Proteiniphilum saccharofermentans]SCD21199.1 NigD-like protein [Proteiniphilum saccharofermentans]
MDDYLVEFATVVKENSNYRFRLDNGRLLIPDEVKDYSGEEGQRVILNYIPLGGDAIKINFVSNIFTGTIQSDGFPQNYSDDPVKIQSVWVGGDWLNLVLEIEYLNMPHKVALFRDRSSSSVDLYFSHSSENDPPGYPRMMYASFLLSDLREQVGSSPVPFRFFINTYTGIRIFELELK